MSKQKVMCGTCKVPVNVVRKTGEKDMVVCPKCDLTDTLENVNRSLGEQAIYHAQEKLQKTMKKAAGRSKGGLSYKAGRLKKPSSKFFVELD